MTFDGVLLASFGGPEGPDEVIPFLERVTAGRGIPRERLEVVGAHYRAFGGVSPINAQNRALLQALRAEFDARGIDVPLYWGNRNSAPFFADALQNADADDRHNLLAIATSAYSSYSGCRQYRENIAAALEEAGLAETMRVTKVTPYSSREGFVAPFTRGVRGALAAARDRGIADSEIVVLFTTHSIPVTMEEASAGYTNQHLAVAERVMAGQPTRWRLVFQSRSGPPQVPWLEPDVNDALREEAAAGTRFAVIVPIGFVSDHMEVVWDLDNEAMQTAEGLGIECVRVATPGVDPAFVAALADLVLEARTGSVPVTDMCSITCCANPRADLPTVPGLRSAE